MLGVVTYDEDDPADDYLREYAEEIGVAETYAKTRVGVFLGEPGETVARPVLRRRRAGPHGLPALRALHGRLPARREEHAGEELPVVRGAARASQVMPERTVTDIKPLRHGGGYAVDERALRRVGAQATGRRRPRAASWSPRARSARTGCSRRASSTARCRSSPTGSASSCARTPRRSSPSRCPRARRTSAPRRDHRLDLPRPADPHRDRRLRRRRRQHVEHLHAADRRRHAAHAAAEARRRRRAPPGPARPHAATRAAGRSARSSCSSCSRWTTRSRCGRARAAAAASG